MSGGKTGGASVDELLGESRFAALGGGRRLHYRLLSAGADAQEPADPERPIVVWVAGMGMSGLYWAPLHRRLGTDACLGASASVIYDRAGLGRSDDDEGSRTLERMARDLLALLDELEAGAGPGAGARDGSGAAGSSESPSAMDAPGSPPAARRFVLVGHSWGGPIARVAASLAPERVAALLLVDPSDEHLRETLLLAPNRRSRPGPALQRLARRLQLRGLPRAAAQGFGFETSVLRELRERELVPRAHRANEAEFACFDAELDALLASPPVLEGIPVTLLSGARPARSARARVRREAMTAAHELSATADPALRLVRAERSGHLVNLSEPELVLLELATLISRSAEGGSS